MQPELNLPAPYTPHAGFVTAFAACRMVAIVRGIQPAEAAEHGRALYEAGFRLIEVPLNSPQPLDSIAAIRKVLPADALVGAGTVLSTERVRDVRNAGGELIVMPHADVDVILAAKLQGLACVPGVATPTEAFSALKHGADALKMFPAEQLGPAVTKAWRAVVPAIVPLLPVGGVTPDNMGPQLAAGATGFGLGSALYKPGQDVATTRANAIAFIEGWKRTHDARGAQK
ncbi:2-dehydro-3-deoxy-6-phosphogalactonate aldolase [Paraburkholderia acidisoli]|uniref:2-dehydro-3-deoxy-6-phosphogalactonate aldolase n=1 Tax=Paraburkholderia acidisoli TaxID=2571748 RepID=A0A7Z2JE33_9BURK|nr:2-dehydro-3-deoxy-6-phosphogalactonate aldolase [Paraburkholderia acidisoli]QGZ60548.1 2-dehydro-3-deoxy-6-phosphogalactonate aldolase [Paraburkholderia acidisoli]